MWSLDFIQNVFDYYCTLNRAATRNIKEYFDDSDPNCYKLSIKNVQLDDNSSKALACIIPFLINITELELRGCDITDAVASAIVFAVFANPGIKRLTMTYNHLRGSFA